MISPPTVVPGNTLEEKVRWWQNWTDFVRGQPGQFDLVNGERVFWGEHLFVGWETHNELFRKSRALGVKADLYTDGIEYQEVTDHRSWRETNPAPLLLNEKILREHCYICGPTGSGKTSLAIMPLLTQLIRGSKCASGEFSKPAPVIILDFKGDPVLFHTARIEALRRGQKFRFFSIEKDRPTYRFNPFRGFDRSLRSVAQLCQLILDALSLNHGKGYGRSYYTERSRHLLSLTLKRYPRTSSFDELHTALRSTVSGIRDTRAKNDAFELLSVIETLTEYKQLVTGPDEDLSNSENVIFMPRVIRDSEVVHASIPSAKESISAGEVGKLFVFNARIAAEDWMRNNPGDPRNITLVVDEAQHLVGENLRGILQDARSFGISTILANQSLKDLRSPSGFDLAPTIMTNTRVKFFFTSPSETDCYAYVERGKGFTKARQFPERGNPWLRDLGPEEFAYHVRLAWPFSHEEYKRRQAMPWPSWDEIPGGNSWLDAKPAPVAVPIEMEEISSVVPHEFPLVRDEEWKRQLKLIRALFLPTDPRPLSQDKVIQDLLFEGSEDAPEDEEAEEDLDDVHSR